MKGARRLLALAGALALLLTVPVQQTRNPPSPPPPPAPEELTTEPLGRLVASAQSGWRITVVRLAGDWAAWLEQKPRPRDPSLPVPHVVAHPYNLYRLNLQAGRKEWLQEWRRTPRMPAALLNSRGAVLTDTMFFPPNGPPIRLGDSLRLDESSALFDDGFIATCRSELESARVFIPVRDGQPRGEDAVYLTAFQRDLPDLRNPILKHGNALIWVPYGRAEGHKIWRFDLSTRQQEVVVELPPDSQAAPLSVLGDWLLYRPTHGPAFLCAHNLRSAQNLAWTGEGGGIILHVGNERAYLYVYGQPSFLHSLDVPTWRIRNLGLRILSSAIQFDLHRGDFDGDRLLAVHGSHLRLYDLLELENTFDEHAFSDRPEVHGELAALKANLRAQQATAAKRNLINHLCFACGLAAIPLLTDILTHEPSRDARGDAARCLGVLRDPVAIPYLIRVLGDAREDWWVRSEAAAGLGMIGGSQAIRALMTALEERDVQRSAAQALGQCGDGTAVHALDEALARADSAYGRRQKEELVQTIRAAVQNIRAREQAAAIFGQSRHGSSPPH